MLVYFRLSTHTLRLSKGGLPLSTLPGRIQLAGVKYTAGFVAPVMRDTYLANHEAPEDCEYYMCGPGMMSQTVNEVLDSLGVDPSSIHYDNFG